MRVVIIFVLVCIVSFQFSTIKTQQKTIDESINLNVQMIESLTRAKDLVELCIMACDTGSINDRSETVRFCY